MAKLLTKEYPLTVLPALAKKLGTTAAMLLQQIHYWTQKKCGKVIDGVRWIYNTYKQWQEQLSFLSLSTVKRAIAKLKELNLILVEQHDKSDWNHTNYYRIDYESLKSLQLSIGSNCPDRLGQDEPSDGVNLEPSTISTENTSGNTTHTEVGGEKRHFSGEEFFRKDASDFPLMAEQLIDKYEEKLKTFTIYKNVWGGDKLIPNPKMKQVMQMLAKVPPDRAERSILAFLGWFKKQDVNKIKCKYKALESAIARDWEVSL
ncbi:hypothetical protein [Chroococcidiopsis sp.]|uniref:hypothetical protein n=1 Tax=Chroococcidiopsis sp. TaxID=3088168 RepID=UPI003F39CF02